MGSFGDLLKKMTIEVKSPDRSVALSIHGAGDLRIRLDDSLLGRHTDDSLSGQITAVVRVAISARARGFGQAWKTVFGDDVPSTSPEPTTSKRAHLRQPGERLRDELFERRIFAVSPRRYVEVTRPGGSTEVVVKLNNNAVRLTPQELEREVEECLAAAVREYRRVHFEIRRKIFGPGYGISNFGEAVAL